MTIKPDPVEPLRVRSKIWLEVDGHSFLGDGRLRLLEAVAEAGSINGAAKALGISYRKAWSQLHDMEQHAPFALLEKRTGGKDGGASLLTQDSLDILERFRALRSEAQLLVDECFARHFPEGEPL